MSWSKIKPHLISGVLALVFSSSVIFVVIRTNAQLIGTTLGFATQADIEKLSVSNDSLKTALAELKKTQATDIQKINAKLDSNAVTLQSIENGNIVIASTFILQNPNVPKEEKEILRARLITRGSLSQRELMERVLTIPIIEPQITKGKK